MHLFDVGMYTCKKCPEFGYFKFYLTRNRNARTLVQVAATKRVDGEGNGNASTVPYGEAFS